MQSSTDAPSGARLGAMKIITQNKKAFFDYDISDRLEAGIVLTGDEVKSLREGQGFFNRIICHRA